MIFIIVGLLVASVILFARLFYMKKQVISVTNQLIDINENNIDKKITIGLINPEIEALTKVINDTINMRKQCEASKIKFQNDLKQNIANMSHDLRTPLTSIKGYIQFLKLDNISDEERVEYLNISEQRTKSLESLLNDFYELSLVESQDFELNLEKINITNILQEILLGKYSDFTSRNLKPNIQIPNQNIYIIAEKKSLERIIENLLSNAIKYARDNVSIYLETNSNVVLLKITNTVINLSVEDVEKIFDRFYMADKTRSEKGTGLGLSIVKTLVEKMNAVIIADINNDVLCICCEFKRL
ncbi:HAMP domain-containing histidine kinase [Clostridium sp. CF011]|uniref:sensor histidine kinase n=1 Tax=unclassified Clostridium TaxID=2614128 RepID=UPI001C0BDD31|nr:MULTISPECIES: HAMP domain-containing sensor histidine kinase [unclassified Clostridium]MBU3091821.1 HAMP domain-containing histidine kinase [Clostridium sp. CF011]MBW9145393.1 HAMP domain-containing histidine kinase [Clostridium sp. CM027]UVE42531.1 HAMP domain-containing histidine kinase [Clostridium sp. CM027]WAG68279.1 HAMP domain-containing histidine kinase [Clostridium sp. CF011]